MVRPGRPLRTDSSPAVCFSDELLSESTGIEGGAAVDEMQPHETKDPGNAMAYKPSGVRSLVRASSGYLRGELFPVPRLGACHLIKPYAPTRNGQVRRWTAYTKGILPRQMTLSVRREAISMMAG
jgi:hypothetical protein